MIIKLLVETMFDNEQKINVTGNENKTAAKDLFDYSISYVVEATKHNSAIENILLGISKFTADIKYEKPDTIDYTIEDKINHNKLKKYKAFFDDYMDNYNIVKNKINIFEEQDITFEKRLISHIKNKYIIHYDKNSSSDDILHKIISNIEMELKNHSNLDLEDISGIHYVVFYVFAECKIFEKPLKA